ncbi:ATP-binding protein [uncultured Nocardioides sp.]|uniref:sensor histidine kinase n=1 Tax=uncultured Nocardioides sp. TaxID=198441 RepID=UPI0026381D02|nr:ATP-binding protein [uncultured Nocardioides sp.]MCK5928200.1 PAS domain S-box protein [Nocardioides sp.]
MLRWQSMTWQVRVSILLAVTAVTGLAAVVNAPDDGKVIGIWPVGAAVGALLLAPRRWALRLLPVVLALGLLTVGVGGRPWGVALGYAVTIAVEVALVWQLLSRGQERTWSLCRDADLRRWILACLVGGAVGAAGGALTALVTGFGHAPLVALGMGTAHLASLMVLTPLWATLPAHDSIAGRGEYTLQWLLITVAAPLVFIPQDTPPLVYLLVPLLAWSALRISAHEALAQMILMLAFAILLTTADRGPFAAAPDVYGLDRDLRGILLASFAVVCAVIVVPLILRVGESVEAARDAQAERDTLDRIVASATGVAIIVTDEQSRISLFNPGAERMLGYRAEEVLGRSTSMLHSPAAVEAAAAQLGVAPDFRSVAGELLRRGVAPVEMGFTRADGVDRTHSMTLSRVTDDQGKVVGYVSTSEDVTDRIETEEALRAALERMREVDVVKDAFVSSVSHELRTPITSIHGYLEMLLDETLGELSPAQRSAVEKVESNSRRLLGLIDDLLTLSRLQEDGLNLAPRVVDLRTVVGDACQVVAPAAETGGLRLRVSVPEEPMPFLGERDMLERALVNLVGNAVKFTPGGGEVEVSLLPREEGSVVVVRDTGIGIPLAEQEHLFTRFFRSSLAQRQAIPGSGLGLSIARAVVHQHGGSLRVESAEGAGTTFYVELPALV